MLVSLTCNVSLFEHLMRKPTICICETKGADQFRGSCEFEAGQRLCFCYTDSTFFLLFKSEISNFLCDSADRFVSDLFGNHIAGFLMTRLIYLFTYQWTVSKLVPSLKHLNLRMYEGLCLNNVIFLKRTFLSSITLG